MEVSVAENAKLFELRKEKPNILIPKTMYTVSKWAVYRPYYALKAL